MEKTFDQGVPLYFCDEATGKKEPIGAGGHMMVATLAPDDDQLLFSRFDDIACLWSTKEKKELHRFRGHKGRVQCMTFSTDSMHAVTGDQGGFIRLWDVRDGRELRAFRGDNKTVWRLALSPDGRRALSADRNRDIILWNMQNGKELYRLEGICAIFTHDGSHAVTGDILGRIRVWRLPPEPVALDKPLK